MMSVITISRGSFSGGKMLGECLADSLGYRCIDRDVIVERAAAYGVPQEDLRDAMSRPPSFWDRFRHRKYLYLTLIQAALTEEVQAGRAVYHGNAGHLLLRGVSHVVRVRVIAPMSYRVALVRERLAMNDADALAYIQKMDQDRMKWTQYLYGVDWGDPALYDLVMNCESLNIQDACRVVAETAALPCFAETPESQAAMHDLALASRVRANLAMAPAMANIEVEVSANRGSVSVRGVLPTRGLPADVESIARGVPGVLDVRCEPSSSRGG
jgi:cytidylate kinase